MTGQKNLRKSRFEGVDLRGSRFVEADLSGVVMRGVQVEGLDIDAPWLAEGALVINGVDVAGFVETELNTLFPGRELRRAEDPGGLRRAWTVLQQTWAATLQRAQSMPPAAVEQSVAGEWSFAQTLRHLVLATDVWLGRGVLELEQPFHPLGLDGAPPDPDAPPSTVFSSEQPSFAEVLSARADRQRMVSDFLATLTPQLLDQQRKNPHAPQYPETVRSCLHVILEEEWEHHRYAVRDLDALAEASSAG